MRNAEYGGESPLDWPALPTETEIYILPDGEIVVADLPVELMGLVAHLKNNAQATITTVTTIGCS